MKKVVVGICERKKEDGQAEYLLVRSKTDYGEFTSFFQPTGGKQEGIETDEETLIREFDEELKVGVKPLKSIAETEGDVPGFQVSWWKCEVDSDKFTLKEDEMLEARWMTKDEIEKENVWPATRKFFEAHIFHQENKEVKFR